MISNERKPKLWKPNVSSTQEDQVLINSIQTAQQISWITIAKHVSGILGIQRTPKQCRDRWTGNLKYTQRSPSFTDKEFALLIELFDMFGTDWVSICQHFPGNSENKIKNFMNATLRRNLRRFNKGRKEEEKIKTKNLKLLELPELKRILVAGKNTPKKWFSEQKLSVETVRIANSFGGENLRKKFEIYDEEFVGLGDVLGVGNEDLFILKVSDEFELQGEGHEVFWEFEEVDE